jgi:hypothetical protein
MLKPGTSRSRGVALILVMIALSIAVVVSLSFLSASGTSRVMANNMRSLSQAKAVAESGTQLVLARMQSDDGWRSGLEEGLWIDQQTLGDGSYSVYVYDGFDEDGDGTIDSDGSIDDDLDDPITMVVIGNVAGVTHRVETRVYAAEGDGSDRLTLVVGSVPMSSLDSSRKTLAEGWGWTVTVLQDSATAAEYSEALTDADVVWVSEQANATSVGSLLTDVSLGLVNEVTGLNDDLKIGGTSISQSGTSIDVTNASHFISSHFSGGSSTIVTGSQGLSRINAGLADGADTLAESSNGSKPMLVAAEAYMLNTDDEPYPGRRVVLPFGGSNFDVEALNDDGLEMLRKSLIWAADSPKVPVPIAWWEMDESSGAVAVDSMGAYDGSYAVSPELGDVGVLGLAPQFDGDTDRVELPGMPFDNRTELSISLWFNSTSPSGRNVLGGFGNGDDMIATGFDSSTRLFTEIYGSKQHFTVPAVDDGYWHQMLLCFDASENSIKLFLDGQYIGEKIKSYSKIYMDMMTVGEDMDYAWGGYSSSQAWIGGIDDIRLFDRVLTDSEALALYEQAGYDPDAEEPKRVVEYTFDQPPAVTPVLVGEWLFDEPAGGATRWATVDDQIDLFNNARIDGYDSSQAYSASNRDEHIRLTTDATGSNTVVMKNDAILDGDLYVGPAIWIGNFVSMQDNAQITGEVQALDERVDFETLSTPSGRPSSLGDQTYNGGNYNVSSDLRFNDLTLASGVRAKINGHVNIYVDDDLVLSDGSRFELLNSNSSLTLYIGDDFTLEDDSYIHGESDETTGVTVYMYGSSSGAKFNMYDTSVFTGRLATNGDVTLEDDAQFYGAIAVGDDLKMIENTGLHIASDTPGFAPAQAYDQINSTDGTYRGDATPGGSGNRNGAAEFDGSSDYIEIPHDGAFVANNGSVSIWFRADGLSGTQTIFAKSADGYGTGGHLTLELAGSSLQATLKSTSTTYTLSGSGISAGTWHHAVVSWGGEGFQLVLDGALLDSDEYTGGLGTTSGGIGNYEPIVLGAKPSTSLLIFDSVTDGFDGRIDDMRIYTTRLSVTQAAELFAHEDPSAESPPLVADSAANGSGLDLYIKDPTQSSWVSGGGLMLTGNTVLTSPDTGSKIAEAVAASGGVSIEMFVSPSQDTVGTLASLIDFSGSGSSINFVVEQDGRELLSRVRTTDSYADGSPGLDLNNAFDANDSVHLIVVYDIEDEQLRVYREGELFGSAEHTGDLTAWSESFKLRLGNNLSGSQPFEGTFYEVTVWDQPFNLRQAQNVYNGSEPGDGLGEGGFEAMWFENP